MFVLFTLERDSWEEIVVEAADDVIDDVIAADDDVAAEEDDDSVVDDGDCASSNIWQWPDLSTANWTLDGDSWAKVVMFTIERFSTVKGTLKVLWGKLLNVNFTSRIPNPFKWHEFMEV